MSIQSTTCEIPNLSWRLPSCQKIMKMYPTMHQLWHSRLPILIYIFEINNTLLCVKLVIKQPKVYHLVLLTKYNELKLFTHWICSLYNIYNQKYDILVGSHLCHNCCIVGSMFVQNGCLHFAKITSGFQNVFRYNFSSTGLISIVFTSFCFYC